MTETGLPDEAIAPRRPRIEWLDHAKGICIVLVVMFYATDVAVDRVGGAGWIGTLAEFARPFRMPDFFLLSGLLLPLVIDRPWRRYLDRKVVHFVYFYVLWAVILLTFRGLSGGAEELLRSYALALVRPYSMLWFIYMLAIFFVVTKLVRRAPSWVVWSCAAALHLLVTEPQFKVWEKFAQYYVFFYTGYAFAPRVFRFADLVAAHRATALAALIGWAIVHGLLVFGGYSRDFGTNLALALVGSAAVISVSVLLSGHAAGRPVAYCGAHSIAIYLAFFIPLAVASKVLLATGLVRDGGWLAFWATVAGVGAALALHALARRSFLRFLFFRPRWFSIDRAEGAASPNALPGAARAGGSE